MEKLRQMEKGSACNFAVFDVWMQSLLMDVKLFVSR